MRVHELQHLAAAMAHEVRNPLNSMAIHIELLETRLRKLGEGADRDAAVKSAQVIGREIERIDHLLEEYLRHAGPREAKRVAIEPKRLIADATDRVGPLATERGVEIRARVADGPEHWPVDAEALAEALEAVLANAVEASPRGRIVEVQARSDDDQAILVVIDQGEGISKDDLPSIFRVGFSRRGRAGIGLAMAKQIVKGHGGSLSAESPGAGGGAVFTLRMPLEATSD